MGLRLENERDELRPGPVGSVSLSVPSYSASGELGSVEASHPRVLRDRGNGGGRGVLGRWVRTLGNTPRDGTPESTEDRDVHPPSPRPQPRRTTTHTPSSTSTPYTFGDLHNIHKGEETSDGRGKEVDVVQNQYRRDETQRVDEDETSERGPPERMRGRVEDRRSKKSTPYRW